jgi:hypothetical protein
MNKQNNKRLSRSSVDVAMLMILMIRVFLEEEYEYLKNKSEVSLQCFCLILWVLLLMVAFVVLDEMTSTGKLTAFIRRTKKWKNVTMTVEHFAM